MTRLTRAYGGGLVRWRFGTTLVATSMLFATSMLLASPARAWNDFGHMEVAAVAFPKLTPKTAKKVAALLQLNPRYATWIVGSTTKAAKERAAFMRAATWADAIKRDKGYKTDDQKAPTASQNLGYGDLLRHAYWHYVNLPIKADSVPTAPTSVPNVATEIPILRAALADAVTSDALKSYDLVWLLHLVGDVHQPLHCVQRFEKDDPQGDVGGNNVDIAGDTPPPICDDAQYCPFGPPDELHAFYDDLEGASYATAPAAAAAAALPTPAAKKAKLLDVDAWVQEGLALAQTVVYVAPIGVGHGPFTVDAAYQAAAHKLGKERIALAGARLANLLNDALGK